MTELSGFWTTSGTPAGHQQASYTQAQWSTAAKILAACNGFEGVAPGYLNNLAGTVTGANTVAINTGGCISDGKWYINDASLNVNIPSAVGGGNTRIDRIVLRCTWADFHAEITRIAGTDAASPVVPAITQTAGTTYDIKLYQALVNTSGTVTLTDERVWASGGVIARQGGNATDWDTVGSTNYYPAKNMIQAGTIEANASGNATVTFPVPFSGHPVISATGKSAGAAVIATITSISETAMTIFVSDSAGAGVVNGVAFWMAIGPIA